MTLETEVSPENHDQKVLESIKAKPKSIGAKAPSGNQRRRKVPIVTYAILISQIIMFFFAGVYPFTYEPLKMSFGLVPSQIMSG